MSQVSLDVIRGIAQAAADSYDGALDGEGKPIEIGLKREEGHPIFDSRTVDGFKVRCHGNKLLVTYQSDIKLKDIHKGNFESEVEILMGNIVKHLKKQYRKATGKALTLTPDGDCDILVQSTSRVRVFAICNKSYKIGGLDDVDDVTIPSKDRIEGKFKSFLAQGGFGNAPENKNQKGNRKNDKKDG
tara:strand:+ start:125 stop:685 length:561 start_codon:yes stop_codon:yes gene_type:complete